MNAYQRSCELLRDSGSTWLVTGVAGFIGSHLLERLLILNQRVIGIDNFITGKKDNLIDVQNSVTSEQWNSFKFVQGDISKLNDCENLYSATFNGIECKVDYVLHQAALGSVPRSIESPLKSHLHNVTGFSNVLFTSKEANVKRFVYASSSSVYGDNPKLPKLEDETGKLLSPYAATKYINEVYAEVYARAYKVSMTGLRYFNVFGPRQDPKGEYAAVIPRWINNIIENKQIVIYGDGLSSRDFCFVENVVQANILAALEAPDATNKIFNVSVGDQTTLNDLFKILKNIVNENKSKQYVEEPIFQEFRAGDIAHSKADISKIKNLLSYEPSHKAIEGLRKTVTWYYNRLKR